MRREMKECKMYGCGRPYSAKGYCSKHYHANDVTPERRAYYRMIYRCYNTKYSGFHNYGGRGITVCDTWLHDYGAFYEHVGLRPTPKHSLDRIDNDGNYEPGNVRWATFRQQTCNTRRINLYGYHGIVPVSRKDGTVRWVARISINYRLVHLGTFIDKESAINARKVAEIKYGG